MRHSQCGLTFGAGQNHTDKLTRTQAAIRISNGSACIKTTVGGVDFFADEIHFAGLRKHAAICQFQFHIETDTAVAGAFTRYADFACADFFRYFQVIRFRNTEVHIQLICLHDGGQQIVGCGNQITVGFGGSAGHTINRRDDFGIAQVQLRLGNLRFDLLVAGVGQFQRGLRVIHFFLADGFVGCQWRQTREFAFCLIQFGFRHTQRCFCGG